MKKTYKNQLPKNMEVSNTNVRVENGEVIVDVEFEEKFEPKDGDFLVDNDGDVFILQKTALNYHYGCYVGILPNRKIKIEDSYAWVRREGCRYATPEEKAVFLERLEKEYNKRWNAETKQLEDIRWEPKHGETYWYVNEELKAEEEVYSERYNFDMCNVRINNCFRTPEAAQIVADQIKEIFKNSKAE